MASFTPVRGTRANLQPSVTSLVDGQFLIETDQGDESKIYTDINDGGTLKRIVVGGGGHEMSPNPSATPSPTQASLVTAVKAATNTNNNVASLWGVKTWSNMCTEKRIILDNSESTIIGSTGIGTWQDELVNPSAADEAGWGWYHDSALELDAQLTAWGATADDIELNFLFDPSTGEPVVLGGYILDTTTGYICIKFASEISDTTNIKIGIDIKVTRTNVGS